MYQPTWQPPDGVRAIVSEREGGVSLAPFASLNLGRHVGDDADAVAQNRLRLLNELPGAQRLIFVSQVHGTAVLDAAQVLDEASTVADALVTDQIGLGLVILTADCLPVFFSTEDGAVIGVAHAGWRGLAAGVLENTAKAMRALWRQSQSKPALQELGQRPAEPLKAPKIVASFGPAIGPNAFEVGEEVRSAFSKIDPMASLFFKPFAPGNVAVKPKYLANLYGLASLRLGHADVAVTGLCTECTYLASARFFSFRRDGVTGRQAAVIWKSKD